VKVDTPLHAAFVVEADELASQRGADVNAEVSSSLASAQGSCTQPRDREGRHRPARKRVRDEHPIVEDDVIIYAGATVLGARDHRARIGDRSATFG
jgi:3-oxoacyl-(acyl-carrier-protein) synthase